MAFPVSRITPPPVFDSLPVAKTLLYPLEKRDYKPYAQNCICVSRESLYLRMWAFEVSPMPDSTLSCVLYLYPDTPERALRVDYRSDGSAAFSALEDGLHSAACPQVAGAAVTPFGGEDLQGVYWGGLIRLDFPLLEQWGGPVRLGVGDTFYGNFYKLCDHGEFAHKGSFYPADFTKNAFARQETGAFEIVAY